MGHSLIHIYNLHDFETSQQRTLLLDLLPHNPIEGSMVSPADPLRLLNYQFFQAAARKVLASMASMLPCMSKEIDLPRVYQSGRVHLQL